VTMEVRYIVFSPEEVRSAIVATFLKQGRIATPSDVTEVALADGPAGPSAVVQLRPGLATEPTIIGSDPLVGVMLFHCNVHRVPIPKRAQKRIEHSINGLTMVLTTDRTRGSPAVGANQVSYGDIANRATQEIGTLRGELARAVARAGYAEGLIAEANARTERLEAARAQSSKLLVAIALAPGLRGRVGRWLVRYRATG
jgi:hypothetical protein